MGQFGDHASAEAREDFESIWQRYLQFGVIVAPEKSKPHLRQLHRFAFALAMLSSAGRRGRAPHKRVFLQEAASDSLLSLHAALLGDARAARFYLRSVAENTWRHLYFTDHPVEYRWLQVKPGHHEKIADLRGYCSDLELFGGALGVPLASVTDKYAVLSRFVHTSAAPTMQLKRELVKVRLAEKESTELAKTALDLGRDVVLIFAVLHDSALDPRQRSFVIGYLDKQRKRLRLRALSE